MNDSYKQVYALSDEHGLLIEAYNIFLHRTKYTKNEIRVYEDGVCEIDVYDPFGFYKSTGMFSVQDLDIVLPHKWYEDNSGYLSTTINNKKIRLHRLLLPNAPNLIDHYDGNKLNNTRENLQYVTHAINIAKITNKPHNSTGITGVGKTKSETWCTSITVNNKAYHKNYKTIEDAILQRYIWEIYFWGRNAPQLKSINNKYPNLYKIVSSGIVDINKVKEMVG